MEHEKDCFVCGKEATHKDRINGAYSLCDNQQCETDLDNYLADMDEQDEELYEQEPDPDLKWKQYHEDPMQ